MHSVSSHLTQERYMRRNRIPNAAVFDVLNAIFLASLLDDLADRRIMYVRNFREKMVFNLEVQATNEPADDLVACCKVRRGLQLVDRPFIFHFTRCIVRQREMRVLNSMSELEYDAEHKACNNSHGDESNYPGYKTYEIDWQRNEDKDVRHFIEPKGKMFLQREFLQRSAADFQRKILYVICHKDPCQIQQTIKEPEIVMLILVDLVIFLFVAKTEKWFCFDIIIHTMDISVGMVDHVVLGLPHVLTCTEEVGKI